MGPITRNQAKLLGQQDSRVSSESTASFGLSPKCVKSPAKATKKDIAKMVERVFDQLSLSTYEIPSALVDDDVLSTKSIPHNMFASHVWENQHHSPSPTMVMHTMVTSTSFVVERLVSFTRDIDGITKYVQDQDT